MLLIYYIVLGGGLVLIMIAWSVICIAICMLSIVAVLLKRKYVYADDLKQKNPLENKRVVFVVDESDKENADGMRGHLEAVGDNIYRAGLYDKCLKRLIDVVLSFLGLIVLSPIYLGFAIAIKIDDPGPVLFTQKRVGKNMQYFKLHKFRTMKMVTPHDVPTHMLDNPDQYITSVGKFMRLHSIDELVQVWDIFVGNMSIIGPRPALWNQDVLISERDKWGANDIKPGLTGWAQINGRDELELSVKAKLDGEYASKLKMGGLGAFCFDVKCFFGTVFSVLRGDGVIEGGTGEMKKHELFSSTLINMNDENTVYSEDEYQVGEKK